MESCDARPVRSLDGTPLSVVVRGAGEPLIIVHGSSSDHRSWEGVADYLAPHFNVYLFDRRGHGMSDDTLPYHLEREIEDVRRVLDLVGGEASLLGHSFGAILALHAALLGGVRRLVLYEPPLPVGGSVAPAMTRALDQSGAATTWWRELAAIDTLGFSIDRYAKLATPTLLLSGTRSSEHPLKNASRTLAHALTNARLDWLEDQGHDAYERDAHGFSSRVQSFLQSS